MTVLRKCERCGAENRSQAKFCNRCGTALISQNEWVGSAGTGVLTMAGRRYFLALAWLALGFLTWFLSHKGIVKGNWSWVALFVAAISFVLTFQAFGRVLDAFKGMEGEEKVAQVLNDLPSQVWSVAHDIPFDGFNVDHLVFSRYGIFVIETKNWSGKITVKGSRLLVNGRRPFKDPTRQVKAAAAQVANELEKTLHRRPFVQAVVCFARGKLDKTQFLNSVIVTDIDNLLSIFNNRKSEVLSDTDLERIKLWLATKRNKESALKR